MEKLDLNYIRDFIINGQVRKALEELLGILQSGRKLHGQLYDDVILLRTQLNEVERRENLNLISHEDASRERAQLQKGILDVINSLEEPGRAPAVFTAPASGAPGKMMYWVVPVVVGAMLLILGIVFREKLFGPAKDAVPDRQEETVVQGDKIPPAEPTVQQQEPAAQAEQGAEPTTTGTGPATTSTQSGGGKKKPADLAISDWQLQPDPPVQKERTQVSFVVSNKGETPTGNFQVEWWAGVNFPKPEKTWTLSLGAGKQQRLAYTYEGYASWYGRLETKVVVDPERAIRDADPSDNVLVRTISVRKKGGEPPQTIKKANLAVTNIDFVPYPPKQGEAARVVVSVANKGDEAALNATVQWWAGVNFPGVEKTWTGINLEPGATTRLTYTYPGYRSWYGNLQTKAVADPDRRIEDRDRSDNELIRTISVSKSASGAGGNADLSFVGWRFVPETPVQGQQTRVECTIENKGNAIASNFNVQWWAGVNYPRAEKIWTGITLRPGEKKALTYTYGGYPSWYGSLQTKIILDPEKRVNDSDRSNNEWVRTIAVKK